jgi:hypothetical protein
MEFITTPNPNAIKIEIAHNLEVGTVIESSSDTDDKLCSLFINIEEINTIFVGPDFLTLTKKEDADWDSIKADIAGQFDKL